MALFKINKGKKANLPSTYTEGYCYFTTDDGKFYIDTTNTAAGRILLNAGKADQLSTARTISLTGDVTGSATFDGSVNTSITATVADNSHNHSASNITSGTLAIARGGTGATTAAAALTNIGASAVTLNGASKVGATASFYAPTSAGTAGQFLKSNGSGAPTWATVTMSGLTHIGNSAPTNTDYVLWVDEDENAGVAMSADAIKYKTFSIATSAWSGSGPYTYQMSATGVTANTAVINLTLDATSQTYQKAQLDWETGANFIKLSTATKPTGTISGYLIATEVTVI